MSGYIVITRPESDARDYAVELSAAGYQSLVEPMLHIEPSAFDAPNLADYDAVIVTSANAVDCYINGGGAVADIPVYCVGKHSAAAARGAGFVDVIALDGTGADLLAHILGVEGARGMRFLHLCGRHVAFDIVGKLIAAEISAEALVVYESVQAGAFSDGFVDALRRGEVTAVTFFSRRTAQAFVNSAKVTFDARELEALFSGIKSLSISDAVLECVRVLPWHASHVSSAPDRGGMLMLLKAYV